MARTQLIFLLLMSSLYVAKTIDEPVCPKGYSAPPNNPDCYGLITSPVYAYDDAVKYCRNDGGDLTSIHNAFENAFIKTLGSINMLIGLRYSYDDAKYHWSDGTLTDYTNYVDNFMGFREYYGDCAMFTDGKWSNADCDLDQLPFICRKPAFNYSGPPIPAYNACPDASTVQTGGGMILSSGFPSGYAPGLNCAYRLVTKNDSNIKLHLTDIDIDPDSDGFYAITGDNLATSMTILNFGRNELEGWEILLPSNTTTLFFYSSMVGTSATRTWKIMWSEEGKGDVNQTTPSPTPHENLSTARHPYVSSEANNVCPPANAVYKDGGVLLSPGYPGNYNSLVTECVYQLFARNNYFIKLVVEECNIPQLAGFEIYYSSGGSWMRGALKSLGPDSQGVELVIPHHSILLRFYSADVGKWKISWQEFQRPQI